MSTIPNRRRRVVEPDDEEEESRSGTPASVGKNDTKRTRRSLEDEGTPSSGHRQRLSNGLASITKSRKGKEVVRKGDVTPRSKHQPGAIVRVKLTNFVTYASAEFFPGPKLNMVIGPNGTGKSTLVCAICLGLGWGTKQLGRASEVSEFVKHGCEEATIEIELQGIQRSCPNPVITRQIKRKDNKSVWLVNNKSSGQRAVLDLARSFSIQIDNLCQFLPQDKVVEFAAMNPIDLLKSTQLAAAPPEMIGFHEDLKKLRAEQKEMIGENTGDREQLENLEKRQESQRGDVERMRQRAEIKRRLGWLERCRPIPEYTTAQRQAKEAKARQRQLTNELRELKAEAAPNLRRVNEKQQYEQEVRVLRQQRRKDVDDGEKKVDKVSKKVDELEENMMGCDNMYNAEIKGYKKGREDLKRIEGFVDRIKKQMEEEPEVFDSRAINEQVQVKVDRRREIEDRARELTESGTTLKSQGLQKKAQFDEASRLLEGLATQSGQQESKLQQLSSDTYNAWQWIKDNRNEFERHVYGPPIVECSLKDPKYADAIESLFQKNEFKIITVQTKADYLLLQRKLSREMRLHDISLRQCSIENLDQFHAPVTAEQLQSFGLEGWAIDMVNGPPTVLAMLCNEKFLHNTGISSRDISDDQLNLIADSPISGFVAGRFSYRFTRRREYGSAGSSTNTKQVRQAQFWTNRPVDTGAKANLQREIAECRSDIEEVKTALGNLKTQKEELGGEFNNLGQEIEALKRDKDERQKALAAFKALPAKKTQQEEKLATINENLNGVRGRLRDIQAQKDEALVAKSEMTIQFASAVSALRNSHEHLLETEIMLIEAQSDFETLKARNEDINQLLQSKQAEEKEASDTAAKATAKGRELAAHVGRLADDGRRLEADGDPSLVEMLKELGDRRITADELDAEIDSEKARLEITQGGSEGMVREFEKRAKEIETLKERVQDYRESVRVVDDKIRELRAKWEPGLDTLVGRISAAFESSFARIGCAGQVVVYKASSNDPDDSQRTLDNNDGEGNGLDFEHWAIHISVKFREEEPLSLLDSHRQSGGERAVSTIFYLMALQSLSRAPFRVVDEINQGMDPRNERMVHGRMVDIACGEADNDNEEGGSQYFLITPKLLSGLKYRRGMRVLCIVSGENMPEPEKNGQSKVDFRKWVRKARELGLGNRVQDGRRVDSGVHLGSSFSGAGNGVLSDMASERSRSQSRVTEVGA